MIADLGYDAQRYALVAPMLQRAVGTENNELVTRLLLPGEDPRSLDHNGRTSLHIAAE